MTFDSPSWFINQLCDMVVEYSAVNMKIYIGSQKLGLLHYHFQEF